MSGFCDRVFLWPSVEVKSAFISGPVISLPSSYVWLGTITYGTSRATGEILPIAENLGVSDGGVPSFCFYPSFLVMDLRNLSGEPFDLLMAPVFSSSSSSTTSGIWLCGLLVYLFC